VLVTLVLLLGGCGLGRARQYPDLPKLPARANFHDRTLIVQKWADNSCFYNPAGMAELAHVDVYDATYGQFEDALEAWFEVNDPDALDVPAGHSYHLAIETGCQMGLDRANK
jgi:hypothetical protein